MFETIVTLKTDSIYTHITGRLPVLASLFKRIITLCYLAEPIIPRKQQMLTRRLASSGECQGCKIYTDHFHDLANRSHVVEAEKVHLRADIDSIKDNTPKEESPLLTGNASQQVAATDEANVSEVRSKAEEFIRITQDIWVPLTHQSYLIIVAKTQMS